MEPPGSIGSWSDARPWTPGIVLGLAVSVLAIEPAPLLPAARAYAALCERYPVLALATQHAPALPLALILSLAGCAFVAGGRPGGACGCVSRRACRRAAGGDCSRADSGGGRGTDANRGPDRATQRRARAARGSDLDGGGQPWVGRRGDPGDTRSGRGGGAGAHGLPALLLSASRGGDGRHPS